MKAGRDLKDLLAEVIRRDETKRDFVVSTDQITMGNDGMVFGDQDVAINRIGHQQIADYTKIPQAYYERMRTTAPELLANNVNTWFAKYPSVRMVRTLDKTARAFLSDRFRTLDNNDLLQAALPPLLDMGVDVMSCEVTDTKLYLKVVDKRIRRDLPTGVVLGQGHHRFDTVSPALVLSNSEVGMGALSCLTSVWTGGCSNLAVIRERSKRHYHVGSRHEVGDEVYAMLSDSTRRLTDAALWATIGDVVKGAFDQARFDATVDKIAATAHEDIKGDPIKVVEVTAKKYGMNDQEQNSVLRHLIMSGDLTKYGLHSAVTRAAEDLAEYDRASEFEVLGGKIIELPKNEWKELAEAA